MEAKRRHNTMDEQNDIRSKCKELEVNLENVLEKAYSFKMSYPSREGSIVVTKIQEALMWHKENEHST
jgi:hypothetical protein